MFYIVFTLVDIISTEVTLNFYIFNGDLIKFIIQIIVIVICAGISAGTFSRKVES